MPQMMPMYWFMMTLTTMFLLMIIINFFYFIIIPSYCKYKTYNINKINYNWIWKW